MLSTRMSPSRFSFAWPQEWRISERFWLTCLLAVGLLFLSIVLLGPLYALFSRSLMNAQGEFVGLANFAAYISSGGITTAAYHSLWVASMSTVIVIFFSFMAAYALTRTQLPGCHLLRLLLTIPILAPSLLPAISLIYLFGNQGILKFLLADQTIYGPIGIVLGSVFWTFPHALMILCTALSHADARQYEAAASLKSSPWRTFWSVTVPSARYGLVSASFVVFTLVITDFGVPKIIGGQFNVLATDIYKQVIGQQRFEMGAVVGVILLLPALLAFAADLWVRKKQVASLNARSVPYQPPRSWRKSLFGILCVAPSGLFILTILGMAGMASLFTYWPYNLELTFANYQFERFDAHGWKPYQNSLMMASTTMIIGTTVVFFNAWLVERTPQPAWLARIYQFVALLPMAVPGLVLGIAYIFFFNHPSNPLNVFYGGLMVMVLSTVVHFYSVAHLTAVTSLKQLDNEFESVGDSLKSSRIHLFSRLILPLSLPAMLDIALYLFVNAMTTVSAVVFLYGPHSRLASVVVMSLEEAGGTAPAAAMAMVIFFTCVIAKLIHSALHYGLSRSTSRWRNK
ncbi:putative 2-aminoethylphosphonate ABC transporter permease subunit [Vibrio metschnikovii]|uniref:putative 2-aminoethylphosphonate ABC transporter permease subunit n=1 Tax=Vibrio metschnikovii TaxID=28172 RepID=UPI00130245EF|nr:putative 2-aminoethylphosphonate ABC transporter permease subunit [Vibrio metschnikovii]EKO3791797.1 putative 2-aminoethylphosphonate ABC transporter permease subunit [Vibrio metschnikovii]